MTARSRRTATPTNCSFLSRPGGTDKNEVLLSAATMQAQGMTRRPLQLGDRIDRSLNQLGERHFRHVSHTLKVALR